MGVAGEAAKVAAVAVAEVAGVAAEVAGAAAEMTEMPWAEHTQMDESLRSVFASLECCSAASFCIGRAGTWVPPPPTQT